MPDLTVTNEYRERTNARWIRLRCDNPACLLVEAYIEPADQADAVIAAVQDAHDRTHVAPATQDSEVQA